MPNSMRYQVDQMLKVLSGVLKISPDAVLRRARLPAAALSPESNGVTARDCFSLWNAVEEVYGKPDMPSRLALAVAHGPFVPAFFAFSCSSDIRTGLQRLSLFKPLIGPLKLEISETQELLTLQLRPVQPDLEMPASMALSEMILFLELFRVNTVEHIIPRGLNLPTTQWVDRSFFHCNPRLAPFPSMSIALEDAKLPFVNDNAEMWAMFEPSLQRKLAEQIGESGIRDRLKNILLEAIPSGDTTSEQIAAKLHMSKRSLQRHLHAEGTSFQEVLDETRSDLARHYLRQGGTGLEEIAYLLGYGSPASFFRAFQSWFGMTPTHYKKSQQAATA